MQIAFAHSQASPADPTMGLSLLSQWTFDPAFLPVLGIAFFYYCGLRAYRGQGGQRFPRWRPLLFIAGVLVMGVSLLGPVDLLADYSFTWHMLQHQWVVMLGAPLILLGAPFVFVIRGLPPTWRRRWFVPFAKNRLIRLVVSYGTRPLSGLMLLSFALFFWHIPAFYNLALRNEAVHYLEHFTFVFCAFIFWWHIVTPYPFASRLNVLMRLVLLFFSSIFNTVLASVLSFSDEVLYAYSRYEQFWGLDMLEEQKLGGILMWVCGGMMHLLAMSVLFFVYAHGERSREPQRAEYITMPVLTPDRLG